MRQSKRRNPLHLGMMLGAAVLLALPVSARAELPKPFDLASTSPAGNYLAARSAGAVRDMGAASAYYRAVLRADPNNPELLERAFLATLASGAVEESFPLADRIVGLDRNHRYARLALAARAIKTAQFPQARTHLSMATRGPLADLTSALLVGWTHLGSNNAAAGVAHIDKLQGADWYAVFKEFHAALIFDLANRRADAVKRIERARELDMNAMRTIDAYGRVMARAGRPDAALKAYADFSKLLARHPMIESAIAELESTKKLGPLVKNAKEGAGEVLFGLAAIVARQGGEDLALIYFQLATYLAPENSLAMFALGELYESLRKYDDAVAVYDRVPPGSILKRNAEIQRSLNLDVLGRKDEAQAQLEAILKQRPEDLEALIALGNVLRGIKRYSEAAERYSGAVKVVGTPGREHWSLFFFRGIANERSKQWQLAEADFKKSLELFPDQPQVLNYLGYSWVDQGINLEPALDMIRRAVALRPNDGHIVDSLGWAYYRLGRYAEAVAELERAVELRPDESVIHDHLGDAYWRLDRKLEARFQWQHAIDLKPEPEDLPKIQTKLKDGLPEEPPARAVEQPKPDKG